jgi:chitin disaccharide deacetylase
MIVAVVNADDFGLSTSINEGISVACDQGILRSASLMPNGDAFDDAIDRLRSLPDLRVGVHLSLVGERPIAPTESLPGLVREGKLPDSYADFTRDYLLRRFPLREVRREIAAQIDLVLGAGIKPTHLDSHQHIHLLPGIFDLTLDRAGCECDETDHAVRVRHALWHDELRIHTRCEAFHAELHVKIEDR